MIDDLVGRGVSEPYRMFTSRAEYRLRLRADNADRRLTEIGARLGCVSTRRLDSYRAKAAALEAGGALCRRLSATPSELVRRGLAVSRDGVRRNVVDLLRYPDLDLARLARIWPELGALRPDVAEQIEIDARYAIYLARQEGDLRAFRRDEALRLPADLDYATIPSLSREVSQVLAGARPATLGAAARLSGITPAAVIALLRYVKRDPARPPPADAAA